MPVDREKQPVILVVDDQEVICELLRRRLAMDGLEVKTATSGEKALEIIESEFINVVLTDIRMPGLDGIEVLKRAKQHNEDTEVVVMTAYATAETAIEAVRAGAYDYLVKPFTHLDDPVNKVRRAISQQSLHFKNRRLTRQLEEMNKGLKEVVVRRTRELNAAQSTLKRVRREIRGLVALHAEGAVGELRERLLGGLEELERLAAEVPADSTGERIANLAADLIALVSSTAGAGLAEGASPPIETDADAAGADG